MQHDCLRPVRTLEEEPHVGPVGAHQGRVAQAEGKFREVLKRDPKNINSVKGIAYLYLQMKKFDEAKEYYRKATELDPNDPEPYYSVAVIDWTQAYQPPYGRARQAGPEAGRAVER